MMKLVVAPEAIREIHYSALYLVTDQVIIQLEAESVTIKLIYITQ